ncbi:MAG TPA: acyl-CoA dehydrogenase family protein [Limnochordales bacterium]
MDFRLTPEQEQLQQKVRQFVREKVRPEAMERKWRPDARDRVPWDWVEELSRMGLRTLAVPREYGGGGASPLTLCVVAEELAAGDMGLACIFDQTWKITRVFSEMASREQKEWFFPRFCADHRFVLAICFTEPAHGSDYVIPYEGDWHFDTVARREGDGWVLEGRKRFISNGADAGLYLVFAATDPSRPAPEGTSCFMVPRDTPGLRVVRIHEKISQRLINNAEIAFEGVRLPGSFLVGEEGRGLSSIAHVLRESAIEAGATALGTARAAYEAALEWAAGRVQGGRPILHHPNVQLALAEMATLLEAARCLIYRAAWAVEHQQPYDYKLSSMAKTFAAEAAFQVARRACELLGGSAIMMEYPLQKYLRDVLSFLHSDGTQEAHRLRIGRMLARELAERGTGHAGHGG